MHRRLFIATKVDTSEKLKETVNYFKQKMQSDKIKWTDLSSMHLTYKFLGDTNEQLIDSINGTLTEIGEETPTFSINVNGLGTFGSFYKPKVMWAGVEGGNSIISLQKNIETGMENFGFKPEEREFHPHLTLGRIKYVTDKQFFKELIQNYANVFFQEHIIDSFHLIESRLTPQGPQYTTLHTYGLKE